MRWGPGCPWIRGSWVTSRARAKLLLWSLFGAFVVAGLVAMVEVATGLQVDWEKVGKSPDRHLLHEIRMGKEGDVTIKGNDRLRALELLGKSYGMFADRVINEQPEQAVSNSPNVTMRKRGKVMRIW